MASATQEAGPSARPATVWTELARVHGVLSQLASDGQAAAELHGLNDRVGKTFGSGGGGDAGHTCDRAAFHRLIGDLRNTVSGFRKSLGGGGADVTGDAANVNRYHGLLKERSQHVSQLHTTQNPLDTLQTQLKERHKARLPAKLHVGALAFDTATPAAVVAGKRKRDDKDAGDAALLEINTSQSAATAVLAAFSAVLEDLAKELQLETFSESAASESAQDVLSAPGGGEVHTHTLTLGGRLLVLDLDLGLVAVSDANHRRIQPSAKVKVSFTTDGGGASGNGKAPSTHRGKLMACLETDIRGILALVFGAQVAVRATATQSSDEARIRRARLHYARLRRNLERLAAIDHGSVVSDAADGAAMALDLFRVHGELSRLVEDAARLELQRLRGGAEADLDDETNAQMLVKRGHGVPLVHAGDVGLTIVYSAGHRADAAAILETVRGIHGDGDAETPSPRFYKAHIGCVAGTYGLREATTSTPPVRGFSADDDCPAQLPTPSGAARLTYFARLDPPVLVPRSAASKVGRIVGWKEGAEQEGSAFGKTVSSTTWIGNLLQQREGRQQTQPPPPSASASPASSVHLDFSAYLPDESISTAEQGLLLDYIPFATLAQLYAVVEVLQDTVAVVRLVDGRAGGGESEKQEQQEGQQQQGVQVALDCSGGGGNTTNPASLALQLSTTLVDKARQEAWHVRAKIARGSGVDAAAPAAAAAYDVHATLKHAFDARQQQEQEARDIGAAVAGHLDANPSYAGLLNAAEILVKMARERVLASGDAHVDVEMADGDGAKAPTAVVSKTEDPSVASAAAAAAATPPPSTASPTSPSSQRQPPRRSPSRRRSSASPSQSISGGGVSTRRRSQAASGSGSNSNVGNAPAANPPCSPPPSSSASRVTRRSSAALGGSGGDVASTHEGSARAPSPVETTKAKSPSASRRRRSASGKQ